ncbi:hypothetical protein P9173_07440 [Bacillus safensis]|uniref:hypothetical protein n=1 Tax=Bacillus safensis TaxID=561879 RepID=UPI001B39E90B|nr:hypothetical protein [Bacillus safensis]MBY0189177.1 hypothetical protein [Bacillus aerophilus]MBQ4843824.1 hypothetical protein [Bacillus safensis]MBQ4871666.1 hypothetical protein [Bacillus safensis]MBQ4884573.1 hypothetical protein [Bacillus safensis]MCY7541595.1 hypothetical protein [Bacillus safensis]
MKKQIIAGTLAFTTLFSIVSPVTSFAAEAKTPTNVETKLQRTVLQTAVEMNEPKASTKSWKKDALVFALRHGGPLVGKLLGNLSSKNGKLVTDNSKALANKLDKLSKDIEQKMIDFMHFELGFPISAARTIAWAIMQVI